MARRLIDCVGKAVKAGRLNQDEAALLLQRTERFAHLTKEQAELNAANSVLTEQMTELSNLEKQVGPPGKAEVVFKTKDKDTAMAAMFHEAQIVTENKLLAKQREVEGEGAIKTQRQVAVEQEIEAVIKGPAAPPAQALQKTQDEDAIAEGFTMGPVYHGTEGSHSLAGLEETGASLYFSPNVETAKGYGKNVGRYFLKLRNPLSKESKIDLKQLKKALRDDFIDVSGKTIGEVIESLWEGLNMDPEAAVPTLRRLGFDAIIDPLGDEIVVFDAASVKLVQQPEKKAAAPPQGAIPKGIPRAKTPGDLWYQGVSEKGETNWVTHDINIAIQYAKNRGAGARINVYTADQVGETAFADEKGNPISPQEYAKTNWSTTLQTGTGKPAPIASASLEPKKAEKGEAKPAEPKPTPVEQRLAIYQTIKEKLSGLIARHAAEIQKLEFKAGMTIGASEGLTAEEIATQEIDKAKLGEIDKAKLLSALGELDALLKYLPAEVRGRVGGFYQLAKGSMGERTLTDFFTKRIQMVAREFERVLVKEYREGIHELFESAKPTTRPSKVQAGKIGPEGHKAVARFEGYSQLTGEQVQAELDRLDDKLKQGDLTAEQESDIVVEMHELSTFGAMSEMTASQLAHAHEAVQQVIKTGRTAWKALEEKRRSEDKAKAEELSSQMPKGTSPEVAAKNQQGLTRWLGNYLRSHFNFSQLLERIFPPISFLKPWGNQTFKAERNEIGFVTKINDELTKRLQAAAGTRSALKIGNIIRRMNEQTIAVPGGKASKMEAIHYVMAWQQPDVRARMEKQEDPWTQATIDRINGQLADPVSLALRDFYRWGYDTIYEAANAVHRRQYGIDLPKNEFYVPMRYHPVGAEKEARNLLVGSIFGTSGLTPSAIKTRVSHNAVLKQVSSLRVFQEHLMEMSHWIHFAEIGREMRNVLNDGDVKMSLKAQFGEKGYADLVNHLDTIVRGGSDRAGDVSAVHELFQHIQSGTAITALAFNLHAVGMQLDSGLRWTLEVPSNRWVPSLLSREFWSSESWKKIKNSQAIQQRLTEAMPPEIRAGMLETKAGVIEVLAAARHGFLPLRLFDAGGTILSSVIVYADARNQGLTEEQALEKAENAVSRLSQPTGLTSKSQIEIASSVGVKATSLFMSDPRFKSALYLESFSNLAKGKDVGMNLRRLAMVHAFGVITQAVGNVLAYAWPGDDDEDWDKLFDLRNYFSALLIAPTQGYFFLGAFAQTMVSLATGQRVYSRLTPISALIEKGTKGLYTLGKEVGDAFQDPDNYEPEKVWKSLDGLIGAAGVATGPLGAGIAAALKQLKRTYDTLSDEDK